MTARRPQGGGQQREPIAVERAPIHSTNGWNPTGHDLLPVPGCRLYYVYLDTLSGRRTQVFLGSQQHLTFVADFDGEVPVAELRAMAIRRAGLYPHLVDLEPAEGLPRVLLDPGA